MLTNFKGKENSNGFARNPQNINRNGRPIDLPSQILKNALKNQEITVGMEEMYDYIMNKSDKLSLRELMNIERLAFARYWYLTGGDMKKYYRVFGIR